MTGTPASVPMPALFILEPIGVDGALEAVETLVFCCDDCRNIVRLNTAHMVKVGESADYIEGTVCDECAAALPWTDEPSSVEGLAS